MTGSGRSKSVKLALRLGLGAILLACVIGAFLLERSMSDPDSSMHSWRFAPTALILAALAAAGTIEMGRLLAGLGVPSHPRWCAVGAAMSTLALVPLGLPPGLDLSLLVIALFTLAPLAHAVFVERGPTAAAAAAGDAALLVLVAFLLGFLVRIRTQLDEGLALLVSVVLTTKSSDIFAYLSGVAIGRHKAIPRISPGKTWEGFIGGAIGALAIGIWLFAQNPLGDSPVLSTSSAVMLAILIAILAPIGDLMESLSKRAAAVKDSGTVLPEFGGVLDIIDSLVVVAPAAYLFLALAT